MSQESKKIYESVLIEDLKAYLNGLEKQEFSFCNIISNRLITDAVFLDSKYFVLIGAILKDITFDYQFFKNKEIILSKAYDNLKKMVKNILEKGVEIKQDYILDLYHEYFDEFRIITSSTNEEYQENKSFSIFVTKYIIDTFKDELKSQNLPINIDGLIFGILNEINRIIRSFGFVDQQLILRLLINYFGKVSEYFRYILILEKKSNKWQKLYLEYVDKVVKNFESFDISDSYLSSIIDLIFEICKEWRFMFIRLLEIPKPQLIERRITMPDIVKQDLKEMVSDLISSKLEDKEK